LKVHAVPKLILFKKNGFTSVKHTNSLPGPGML